MREFNFLSRVLKYADYWFPASLIYSKLYRFLFYFEHVVVEEHMKFLVCVVNAKLFKGVCCKIFKPENVQNSNKLSHVFA